jgi:hypothetical protein
LLGAGGRGGRGGREANAGGALRRNNSLFGGKDLVELIAAAEVDLLWELECGKWWWLCAFESWDRERAPPRAPLPTPPPILTSENVIPEALSPAIFFTWSSTRRNELLRLSTTVTVWPASNNASTVCEPVSCVCFLSEGG